MSKRTFGAILLVIGIITYHLLAEDIATPAIWQTELETKAHSHPLPALDNYVLWGGNKGKNIYKLFEINSLGQKVAETPKLPHLPFDPIVVGNRVVMADRGRMLRGFRLPGLEVAWEAASAVPFEMAPLKCGSSNVIQASGNSIFCFEAQTGKQIWDITLADYVKNYACDRVVVAIHGYKDLANTGWKCSGYNLEEGVELWTLEESVSPAKPIFVKDVCILTTSENEILVIHQLSGEILFRNGAKGYIQVQALDDAVLLSNLDYSSATYLSLISGKSWTTSLKRDFTGSCQIGNRLIIADKESLRCFDTDSGILEWQKNLGDIYNACPHRNGIFVTYKKSFAYRTTYAACIGADSGKNLWTAKGTSLFRKPCPTAKGDFLVNYDGTIRLMPKPVFNTLSNSPNPSIPMPDPSEKVNEAFKEKELNEPPKSNEKPQNKGNIKENPDFGSVW